MMIIIDDDIRISEKIKNALADYDIDEVSIFNCTKECPIDMIMRAELIFLDIEMPEENGIDYARKIKEKFKDIKIIFISNHVDYVFDSFNVQPFFFIRKRNFEYDLKKAMSLYAKLLEDDEKVFTYKINGKEYELKIRNIIYFEKCSNNILIHMKEDKPIKIFNNLNSIMEELNDDFIIINRSVVLHIKYLEEIDGIYALLSTGEKIEISRRRRADAKIKLMDYIRRNNL